MNVEVPATAKQPLWKRPLRLAFVLVTLLAAIAILSPYGIALLLEKRLGDELTRKFGVPCRFDSMQFGWLSGATAAGIEIGNAKGFNATHPALRLGSMRIDFDVARLFAGALAVDIEANELAVFVDLSPEGRSNFDALIQAYSETSDEGPVVIVEPRRDGDDASSFHLGEDAASGLDKVQFQFALLRSAFELRRNGTLVESLRIDSLRMSKELGRTPIEVRASLAAPPLHDGQPNATIAVDLRGDPSTRSGSISIRAERCEVSRWLPLVEPLLGAGALTSCAGTIDGLLEARFEPAGKPEEGRITTSGDLTVSSPALAGAAVGGHDIAAKQLVMRPTCRIDAGPLRGTRSSFLETLASASLDIGLEASDLAISRNGAPVESFAALRLAANKSAGAPRLRALLEAEGTSAAEGKPRMSLLCTAESDTTAKFTRGILQFQGMDLARYRALAGTAISTTDLSAAEGLLSGRLDFEADFGSARRIDLNGEVAVDGPRFTGALLQGTDVRGERFALKPSIRALMPDLDGTNRIDLGKTAIDFGFASLQSLDAEARKQRGIPDGGACEFRADLAALSRLGGPFARLAGVTGQSSGLLLLPKELFEGNVDSALATLRDPSRIRADAEVRGLGYVFKGLRVENATAKAQLENGVLMAASSDGTRLNAGPLQLGLRADATKPQIPFEASLAWKGGAVEGEAAELLRYLVPLLAGSTGKAADFRSVCDLNLRLQGFALRQDDESALQWLDRWNGSGDIALTNGKIVPAAALQPLLPLLGQNAELSIDRIGGSFTMQQGAITHRATKWVSKGKDYGLSGKVRLDGGLELSLDVTSLLEQHKDGKAVAGFLGNQPLLASIGGNVDAPKLVAPDLGKLLQQALQAAPRNLLEQRGQELLQKGFDRLFGDKKKKDEPNKKQ